MDILRKSLAPISDAAWDEINDQAKITLKGNLSARALVDVSGPHGFDLSAVNLGRLETGKAKSEGGVEWGVRKVQPLVETRVPFTLNIWDLDDVARGAKDPELEPLEDAARKAALFEERAVYQGFKDGSIEGIIPASPHKAIPLSKNANDYQATVEEGILALQEAGIPGDYSLVLGTVPYKLLMQGDDKGYPLQDRIKKILGGGILWSPALKGGVVLSTGEDWFELTLGVDYSIGYLGHTAENVKLYLTSSFTFRVLEPRAAVELKLKS